MNYLYSKYDHYISFVEKKKTDRLCKNLKVMANSKHGKLIKEIFNNPIDTNYKIEKDKDNKILISFHTNSLFMYRLDIFKIIEEDKSDNFINHISFSDYDNNPNDEDKYEDLLNRNEMREILNRIHYILLDLVDKQTITDMFCIGGAKLLAKNNIYKYVLKVIVGGGGFDKLETDKYDTGFGLYFKIK